MIQVKYDCDKEEAAESGVLCGRKGTGPGHISVNKRLPWGETPSHVGPQLIRTLRRFRILPDQCTLSSFHEGSFCSWKSRTFKGVVLNLP